MTPLTLFNETVFQNFEVSNCPATIKYTGPLKQLTYVFLCPSLKPVKPCCVCLTPYYQRGVTKQQLAWKTKQKCNTSNCFKALNHHYTCYRRIPTRMCEQIKPLSWKEWRLFSMKTKLWPALVNSPAGHVQPGWETKWRINTECGHQRFKVQASFLIQIIKKGKAVNVWSKADLQTYCFVTAWHMRSRLHVQVHARDQSHFPMP